MSDSDYKVRISHSRLEKPIEPGHKDDQGKRRWHLLPFASLAEVVDVLEFGADKYGEGNWRGVQDWRNRYFDALTRHVLAWVDGDHIDKQTGKSHLAHAICCLLFMMELSDDN
jgi:hypothetical protein